ncbi:MAG TPA: glycosyltransferase [Epsilonproteobacteria bacterium]|nr:glycosyltransferase [Campylobacterota bacterium]
MRVSGFTFLKNGQMLGYPFIQSIESILPIVDEFVIALGPCDDETEAMLLAMHEPKLKIIHTQWNDKMKDRGYVYGQQKMIAQFNCTGDWVFYLEADEVVHEDDLTTIQTAMQNYKDDDEVEALVFDYMHFYGNKNSYLWSPGWYRRAPRILKNTIRSYAPDGLFWLVLEKNKVGRYPKAALVNATMYHYGWVRSEEEMNTKSQQVQQYWDKIHKEIDYSQISQNIIQEFKGTHPKNMLEWLGDTKGIYKADPDYVPSRKEKKHQWMLKLEHYFGLELSKKHYKLIR